MVAIPGLSISVEFLPVNSAVVFQCHFICDCLFEPLYFNLVENGYQKWQLLDAVEHPANQMTKE